MKADLIIKNANIFTVDDNQPHASCMVIKDGKFVYVGTEDGLKDYEGEERDLGGHFVMPAIIDSHVHVTASIAMAVINNPLIFKAESKKEVLDIIRERVEAEKGWPSHNFFLHEACLQGEKLTRFDLDEISPDEGIFVLAGEPHSGWCNTAKLRMIGVEDDTPDPAPGLAFFVRDENGVMTGRVYEGLAHDAMFTKAPEIPDEYIISELKRWDEWCRKIGIVEVTECGMPGVPEVGERILDIYADLDRKGEVSVTINGSYGLNLPKHLPGCIEELKRYNKKYNTEHLKVRTLKIWYDGTTAISTSYLLEPRFDNGLTGGRICNVREMADIMKQCDENDFDIHLHVIGDKAIRDCLDAAELARKELGGNMKCMVTLAHNELISDEDLARYKELGVTANFTPWWSTPSQMTGGYDFVKNALGDKRFATEFRIKDAWDTGANVTFSCDQVGMGDYGFWNPYLGMEVAMLRRFTDKTLKSDMVAPTDFQLGPSQAMKMEDMIKGYTLNGAVQNRCENDLGSIEAGKEASFIIHSIDLTKAPAEGISNTVPDEVYFKGVRVDK